VNVRAELDQLLEACVDAWASGDTETAVEAAREAWQQVGLDLAVYRYELVYRVGPTRWRGTR
jgi:hypothetical protein